MAFSSRSVASDTLTVAEVLSLGALDKEPAGPGKIVAQLVRRLRDHFRNCVQGNQPVASLATTASTQATGATGATVARVNLAAFKVCVNGQQKSFTAEADRVLHDTTVYTGADAGAGTSTLTTANCYAYVTIVAKSSSAVLGSGTITLVNCKGATATSAALALAARCTDAEIQTKVGAGLPWVKVADVILYRSGDTTIALTYDHTVQPMPALNVDSNFFGDFAD